LGNSSGNIKLRRKLGWGKDQYESVKQALFNQGKVTLGGGRGGSVSID
jgi:hypothetical protein